MNGRQVAEALQENAGRVRRVVPLEYRAGRTQAVYDTALFMYEQDSGLTDEQVVLAFTAIAWTEERR